MNRYLVVAPNGSRFWMRTEDEGKRLAVKLAGTYHGKHVVPQDAMPPVLQRMLSKEC